NSTARYHQPIRGAELRRMLKRHGFRVLTLPEANGAQTGRRRIYNRDAAAVLNYRLIAESLAAGRGIPSRFCHPRAADDDSSADGSSTQPAADGAPTTGKCKRVVIRCGGVSLRVIDDGTGVRAARLPAGDGSTSSSAPRKRQRGDQPAARAPKRPRASNGSSAPASPRPSAPAAMCDGSSGDNNPTNVLFRDDFNESSDRGPSGPEDGS
ncbi:hypothetical protein H4R18_001670, partial [Coemansia javaensis]